MEKIIKEGKSVEAALSALMEENNWYGRSDV